VTWPRTLEENPARRYCGGGRPPRHVGERDHSDDRDDRDDRDDDERVYAALLSAI
jgi:hypothetical protein